MSKLDGFEQTLASLKAEHEQIQLSPVLGITFLDGRELKTVFEEDPQLREILDEYYRTRTDQMERFGSEVSQFLASHT